MATIVLSAAGMALGGAIGGSFLGLSMATIGRAAGATVGRMIDQRILGAGSDPVEVGRVDRFRLTSASEGAAVPQVFGRVRVPGQVIWATKFEESSTTTGGGKGSGPQPKTTTFSYSLSLAIALCEGEITRVGRVWADGVEIATDTLSMRVYAGTETQPVDPKIEAVEGAGNAPAYRGVAYVVFEDLQLDQFGNRVPQFTFEVMRPDPPATDPAIADIARQVQAVALIPGTGEYALSTTHAFLDKGFGEREAVNVNSPMGGTDFTVSATALSEELPECSSSLLVVSWFGDDLRCGDCTVKPKVEQTVADAEAQPWRVSGVTRANAETMPQEDGRPIYGGTPTDQSVVEAIQDLNTRGIEPVFYPFILMEQQVGNGLPDPYSDATDQPALPWRGRITLSKAPGQPGSPDQTATAEQQVAAFMGDATLGDFSIDGTSVTYSGTDTWRYRRFILHYARLCAAAGGVSAFCIGSEMRGLTQIRGANGSYPAVDALKQLAAEVRSILGPSTKISYAADWSEYHGYQPGGGDKIFHLDPLWADPNIDFIGIDNYMPLSDWRDGTDHADADWGSIYNLDYLTRNVAGGEGYEWYYHSAEARDAQIRTPITDGDGEPWIWRFKDLKNWWGNTHHNRIGGTRSAQPTDWVPASKPIWFTEFGCAAIDKATNQPNKFLDPKSSESSLPYYSTGRRDDVIQMQYLRAMYMHFADEGANPISDLYGGQMVDMSKAHVWAWDTRPFPQFPLAAETWSDGANYARGHWLNGRSSSRTLASVVTEICGRAGVTNIDVTQLYGLVRGYVVSDLSTARAALQPLLMANAIEVSERDGALVFTNRSGRGTVALDQDLLAVDPETGTELSKIRSSKSETVGRVQAGYLDAEADYEAAVSEAVHPTDTSNTVSRTEFPLALLRAEGQEVADRWVHEAQSARDTIRFGLPPSNTSIHSGDVVTVDGADYRVDRIEEAGLRLVEATGITSEAYEPNQSQSDQSPLFATYVAPTPVELLFMDLPMLPGDTDPQQPFVPVTAKPWPGTVAVYGSNSDSGFILKGLLKDRSVIGQTQSTLTSGALGRWDRQAGVEVKLVTGSLSSADEQAVLSGTNLIAIGDGSADGWEIIQFQNAELIAPDTYRLSSLLRGISGSDAKMREAWPAGSYVVLLDQRPDQVTIPTSNLGLPRYFRYAPANRPFTDATYRSTSATIEGEGWRPYRVAHLTADVTAAGAVVSWKRRSRVLGDSWRTSEVPLGETTEAYQIDILQAGARIKSVTVSDASWTYPSAEMATDLASGSFDIHVAQLSDRYGAGPARIITVTP